MESFENNRPLRVLYITPGGIEGRGGMGMMARYLVGAYRNAGHLIDCRVLDSYGPGPFYLMPFYYVATLLRVMTACLTRKADIVHLHMAAKGSVVRKLLLLRLAHLFAMPTILHIHGSTFQVFCDSLSPLPRALLVASIRKATSVVVIGTFWQRYLIDAIGVQADSVTVIHNGVPMPPEPPPRKSNSPLLILALGALGQRKGTPDLLQALASPTLQPLDWRAVIAGNGDVDHYRTEAETLGIGRRVEMPGWVGPEAAQRLLATADIFTLPSHNEGLPVSVLEAMAAKLPVVTTPVGAITDLVIRGETGILVQPGAVDELAGALGLLITDPDARLRFGSAGRRRVQQAFTIEQTAQHLADLYHKVVEA